MRRLYAKDIILSSVFDANDELGRRELYDVSRHRGYRKCYSSFVIDVGYLVMSGDLKEVKDGKMYKYLIKETTGVSKNAY